MELVKYSVEAGVCRLTLDSQHNRNALSRQLIDELLEGLDRADRDLATRMVLIAHRGPTFCSGADLREAASTDHHAGPRSMVEVQRTIATLSKPVVARVGGAVRAGGIGIVAACDIAVAAVDATFALTEARLGLAPAVISVSLLTRMNPRDAQFTFLTADTFTGSQAADYGLVTRAVPSDRLDDEVDAVCASLLRNHPQGLRETKRLLSADLVHRTDSTGDELIDLSVRLFASPQAKEAMTSFLATRRR